jgi:ferredoxin
MKRWKTVLVALISLWLPVQGYGAVAMPFCQQHGMAADGTGLADSSHEHHDAHAGHMAHNDSSTDAAGNSHDEHDASGLACNNCGACHLACSPSLTAVSPALIAIGNPVFSPTAAESPHSFFPEQLQRPPLPAFA